MPAQTLYGTLDVEAGGGDSQPAHKSYGRIIFAGLALLAFVLIAVAAGAAGNDSHFTVGESLAPGLATEGPCTRPEWAVQCYTAQSIAKSHCSKIQLLPLQKACINMWINARVSQGSLPKCCVN